MFAMKKRVVVEQAHVVAIFLDQLLGIAPERYEYANAFVLGLRVNEVILCLV